MFQLSANISMLFAEFAFPDRIEAAAKAGFRAVECQFPYGFAATALRQRLDACGLIMNSINTPMGDAARGEFGLAALPGEQRRFRRDFETALDYAMTLGATTVHCMSGAPAADAQPAARATFLDNLLWASQQARACGVTVVIEPLNTRDRPGYFVSRSDEVVALLETLDCDNVRMLFDAYHIQIMEGDLLTRLRRHWPRIGHVQIASVPGRREPDEGELAFGALLAELDVLGWEAFVGAEYNPRGLTAEGLGWAQPWLHR